MKWVTSSGGGSGAGRDRSPCKEMPLLYKYLIKITEIFSWPPKFFFLLRLWSQEAGDIEPRF